MINLLVQPKEGDWGRVVCGMAWPGEKPGFAAIVGEERLPRTGGKVRHCHILAEAVEYSKSSFLAAVGELQALYATQGVYGRYDESNIVHLYKFNSEAVQRGQEAIAFYTAPYSSSNRVELYADMIISRLRPVSKSLHLYSAELTKSLAIAPEERTTATAATHPAVAALGYAISMLDLYAPPAEDDGPSEQTDDIDEITGY